LRISQSGRFAFQSVCENTVTDGKGGCGRCATCCHTRRVAGRFGDAESTVVTKKDWSVSGFFGFSTRVPEQAVLTSAGIGPKALGYRALRCSGVRKKPSELSELTRVHLQFLVFLLRIDFDNMRHFCKNGDGLLLERIKIISG
jgi:hypothetical protein